MSNMITLTCKYHPQTYGKKIFLCGPKLILLLSYREVDKSAIIDTSSHYEIDHIVRLLTGESLRNDYRHVRGHKTPRVVFHPTRPWSLILIYVKVKRENFCDWLFLVEHYRNKCGCTHSLWTDSTATALSHCGFSPSRNFTSRDKKISHSVTCKTNTHTRQD